MSFGSKEWQEWVLDEDASLAILEYAYHAGINTWDTASGHQGVVWTRCETNLFEIG